jgi:transcriptional regulator with XRE-family HTH domain
MMDLEGIATALRTERKRRRLSQHKLASMAGVSRPLIANLETGRLPEIGVTKIIRLLNSLGLDFRITTLNTQRPTLEDILAEENSER